MSVRLLRIERVSMRSPLGPCFCFAVSTCDVESPAFSETLKSASAWLVETRNADSILVERKDRSLGTRNSQQREAVKRVWEERSSDRKPLIWSSRLGITTWPKPVAAMPVIPQIYPALAEDLASRLRER